MSRSEYDDGEPWGSIDDLVDGLGIDPATYGASTGTRPVRWRDLTPADTAAEWTVLRDWVEWVTVRFDIPPTVIPACWWRHGALVEELSALRTAWAAAYDPTDSGLGPVMWLERWYAAKPRLRNAYAGSCSNGHKDSKPRDWSDATDQSEWDAWVTEAHGTEKKGTTR
jgi:hypothetical protein